MYHLILFSICFIGCVYGSFKAYKFLKNNSLYRNIRDCQGIFTSLREQVSYCVRYNQLSDLEKEIWEWYYEFQYKVPNDWLENRKRTVLDSLYKKRELLKPRAFSYS